MSSHAAADIERLVSAIFERAGCGEEEACLIASRLIDANLVGHDSHGVIRVPIYVQHLRDGIVKANQTPEIVRDSAAFVVMDGRQAFGQVTGEFAVRRGVARARETGCATVALYNTGHLGRLGLWAEMAADAGIISLMFVNTSGGPDPARGGLLMAPHGGTDRRMSINPIAFGAPIGGTKPLIYDATMAATAGGKVMVAHNAGTELAPGQIFDRAGQPSTTPQDLFDGGSVLPFGGHKGFGLAVVAELLAGALSGGGCSVSEQHPLMNNLLAVFIDPDHGLGGQGTFADGARGFADWIVASPPAEPGVEVMTPGTVEHRTREHRMCHGLALDTTTLRQLHETALSLNVPSDVAAIVASEL